jgi:lysophospholipase L1-like esterase
MPFFISACTSPPAGIIIFCAGDSITAEAYPHFLRQILNQQGIKARVLNYGRNGNTSGEYLRFLEGNVERLKEERPDIILLELGTNDVRVDADNTPADVFKDNLKKIISVFRTFQSRSGRAPKIFLATIPPIPPGIPFPFGPDSVRRVFEEINPAIRAICEEENILSVDNYSIFLNEPSLLPDVHPSREGYRRLAENWYAALKPLIKQ